MAEGSQSNTGSPSAPGAPPSGAPGSPPAAGRRGDRLLRQIAEGTAGVVGEQFFRSLTRHLAGVLEVRYAFVAEVTKPRVRVRTLAFWTGESFAENFEYNLDGTPCQQVLRGEVCHYADGVQSLFPQDADLIKLSAQSYLAVPLLS